MQSRRADSAWQVVLLMRRLALLRCSLWLCLLVACSNIPVEVAPTPTPVVTPTPRPDALGFANGHTLRGAFRTFWQQHDGVATFGLPLTEELWIDGAQTQYFERARFELTGDGQVRLGDLGAESLALQRIETQPDTPRADSTCLFFDATGHNLCGAFRTFWEQYGGETVLGMPLTEVYSRDGGQTQYFERARFEQPAGGPAQLAPLGDEALSRLPAHSLLRASEATPAPQRASLKRTDQTIQPLQTVRAVLETEASGAATVFWGDTRGQFWTSGVTLDASQTEVEHQARGALGPHGAVVVIDGRIAGVTTDVFRLDATTAIVTGEPRFDELIPRVKAFMDQDISEYAFDGHAVRGYRSPDNPLLWLRDHVHQGKGYAYWEQDMTSLLDQFRRLQRPNGAFDDYLGVFDFGPVHGRKEVEADLEYLFIEGVYRAWQATGDDDWLRRQIAAMERGLSYAMTDPQRWDQNHRLVKRPFTIDTWDFEIGQPTISPDGNVAPRHWIDEQTRWSIFHGDNTGYAHAIELLARMYEHLGDGERAAHWRAESRSLIERLNALAWNGTFYRHMVHLTPVEVPVDEAQQLSLSNAYALNRQGMTPERADAIISEYQARRRPPDQSFAEWYSIDPPFPAGVTSMPEHAQGHRPGEYVNGGIMPLVGGELARGAFSHGHEAYGFDILQRYYSLIAGTGASYLWYHPIGQPGISGAATIPTDGWGSSAMLAALIEGAAGVTDQDVRFSRATIAPRWSSTREVDSATVTVRYGASNGYVAYRWERTPDGLRLSWTGSGASVDLHVLLPAEAPDTVQAVLNGQRQTPPIVRSRESRYIDLSTTATGDLTLAW
ncbi:MAG TPA: hypothetical protein VFZ66_09610 [Herpetosiphonaceae bacterium]